MITGEQIQRICDIYLGHTEDFEWNPLIAVERYKQLDIRSINSTVDNPKYIFCYTHRIHDLFPKLVFFKNQFVLVTHNSDYTITETDIYLANHPKIIRWFSQNVNIYQSKLFNLPIGIANSQWGHGNLDNWKHVVPHNPYKKGIYFYFNTDTNPHVRTECKKVLELKGLQWDVPRHHLDYLNYLSTQCKYAISPVGNGVDCHRVWECLYTYTIPICIRCPNTEIIAKDYPVVLINSWDEFDPNNIAESQISFSSEVIKKLKLSYCINKIQSIIPRMD